MFAEVLDEGHFIHAGLLPARLHFGQALGLLFGRQFQAFEILIDIGEVELGGGEFAFDFLQRRAQIFAA
jgi:hypothetical protein